MVFGEVIGNPGMDIMDVPAVAKITQAAGHTFGN
jgi:O-acetylhomoserine (thiol)-lyase